MAGESSNRGWSAFAALVLVAAVAAAFAGGLEGPFLFDDRPAVVENETIRSLARPLAVLSPPADTTVAGRPVVNLTLALNHAAGGLEPFGYHLANLALHVGCALLLWALLRRTLARAGLPAPLARWREGLALATALLWAVHPMVSEVVYYVTPRTETVAALCLLATLYALARGAESATPAARRRWHALAVGACALGMASKEVMAVAPLLALLWDRAFLAGSFAGALRARARLYAALAATWAIALALLVSTPRGRSVGFDIAGGPMDYLRAQCLVVPHYLRLALWPHPLAFDYGPLLPVSWEEAWPGACLLAALVAATLWALVREPRLGFAGAWVFGILAPSSSFVPIVTEVGSERRMYLPLAALVALLVLAAARLAARLGAPPHRLAGRLLAGLGVALAAALGWRTATRAEDYETEIRVWRSAAAARPENPRAWYNLGEDLVAVGEIDEGIVALQRAAELFPGEAFVRQNLGAALSRAGRDEEAEGELRAALAIDPDYHAARLNLAGVLANRGRMQAALAEVRAVLRADPENAGARALARQIEESRPR